MPTAQFDNQRAGANWHETILTPRNVADAPPGMLQKLVTLETFGIRGGKIHEVEAFPFVTLPYGLGNGWTPGSGR